MDQPRERRETGTTVRLRQTGEAARSTDPDSTTKCRLHVIGNSFEFCPASRQDNLSADWS